MRSIKKAFSKVQEQVQIGAQKTAEFIENDGPRIYLRKMENCCCEMREQKIR